jgi:membrane carboxypeptidase/penicillin-binding protein PbpC
VIIDPHTGAILALVGSRDFNDEAINGQVNIALTPQQPGSSIKPFTYLTTFRNGWTPSTVLWDVPISYEIPGFGVYEPVNYDGKFRGPVSVRTAIANSINVPAIQALDHVGVAQLLQTLNDVGVTSLGTPDDANNYGLSLTLGAGEVYLLEWTNAFATIANGGTYRPPYAIDRIERNGQVIEGYPYQVPEGRQAIDPALDYLLRDILSDQEARIPSFGRDSVLSPPYPAGAKTGTTNDFRDNWTMGFTTEMTVGVWVGNTDNSPMINVSGVTGAGPIWRGIMDGAQQWYPAQAFAQPQGIFQQTVCVDDGGIPSQYCQEHSEVYTGIFASNYPPPDADNGLYRELLINPFTGLVANDFCSTNAKKQLYLFLPNPSQLIDISAQERNWLLNTPEGQAWATQRGIPPDQIQAQPPTQACGPDTQIPEISINDPAPNSSHSGTLIITGTADAPNFSHYYVDFGFGPDPQGWGSLQAANPQAIHDGVLGQLDLAPFENGPMTIRVVVVDASGHSAEQRVTFNVENPTETPKPTSTDKPPDTPTPTLTPAATEAPTETLEVTAEP